MTAVPAVTCEPAASSRQYVDAVGRADGGREHLEDARHDGSPHTTASSRAAMTPVKRVSAGTTAAEVTSRAS